jgi:cytochrome bd-type quinol oxidase subunit 2
MDLMSWLELLTGVVGVAVATYGAVILLTGRPARADRRAFRRTRDAGLYYACFGLALALLVLSTVCNQHGQSLLAAVVLVGTMALVGLAVRFRPRQNKHR